MQTRRRFVATGAGALSATAFPLSSWLGHFAHAQAATKLTRHDVASAEGQAMLKIYAGAVGKMMATTQSSPGNPLSWLFQWYTHAVPDDRTKAAELARIYPSASDPNRALASKVWSTCEAHSNPAREDFFFPWHRLFLIYFEKIIRQVSGEPKFTLPYWNYTGPSPQNRILPVEFRSSGDPVWKPLFRPDRKAGTNNGVPIDQISGANPIDINAMKSIVYGQTAGDAGLCSNVDNNPHGSVHVDVGNQRGMGRVPWAGNDPIFWLHHCNIDRIWASWIKAGGADPTSQGFKHRKFTFADGNGVPVEANVGSVLDLDALDYDYDRYIDRPPGSPPFPSGAAPEGFAASAVTLGASGPVTLGASPTTVSLKTQPTPEGIEEDRSKQLQEEGSVVYLRLNDVKASAPPDVGYDVYLEPSADEQLKRSESTYVGSLSFFEAAPHGEQHGAAEQEGKGRNYSFVVTDRVRELLKENRLSPEPNVTLVPNGTPSEGAVPKIGSVSLVSS
jgi:tyrosinase